MNPVDEFAHRVFTRRCGKAAAFDPIIILAIVTAAIEIAKLIRECYLEWKKDEIVDSYNSWSPLGWLRRRRIRKILAANRLPEDYAGDFVTEAAAMSTPEFENLFYAARRMGNF